MGIVFLVLQIVFDILAFIGYMRLTAKIDDTNEYVEIESVKTRYLEKQSNIFKDSIKLQNESLRDVFDLTKKVIEYNEPKGLDTEKPDTGALVSGWNVDEIDEPELVSAEEFRKNIDSMACQRVNPYAQQAIINNLNCQNMYPWNTMYYYNGRFWGDALMKMFNKDFIANDKFAIGVVYNIHSWLFGINIEVNSAGILVQVGIGPFWLYIV